MKSDPLQGFLYPGKMLTIDFYPSRLMSNISPYIFRQMLPILCDLKVTHYFLK